MSLIFIILDHLTDWLDPARASLTAVVTPIVVISDFPVKSAQNLSRIAETRLNLVQEIAQLNQEQLSLQAQNQKMDALIAENNRLRELLGSAAKLRDNVVVAELVGVDPDPGNHEIIIDKGAVDKVFVGQPLLDSKGLMGQVISVSRYTSRVLLVSDRSHSVPVQVVRSNLRLVAQGIGVTSHLNLMFVQETADIREGDLLITSGLGGRFPSGYPVGVVNRVEGQAGKPFALVTAVPSALLDRSRYVLLVFTEGRNSGSQEKLHNSNGD